MTRFLSILLLCTFGPVESARAAAECPHSKIRPGIEFSVALESTKSGRTLQFEGQSFTLPNRADIDSKDIERIELTEDAAPLGTPHKVVAFTLTKAGTKKLATLTEKHFGRALVVVLAGEAISAPTIRSAISEGRFFLSPPKDRSFSLNDFCRP